MHRRVTEMIDVAPFEFLAWMDEGSLKLLNFPSEMLEDVIDIETHWITEDGAPAKMKSGAQIMPTVRRTECTWAVR